MIFLLPQVVTTYFCSSFPSLSTFSLREKRESKQNLNSLSLLPFICLHHTIYNKQEILDYFFYCYRNSKRISLLCFTTLAVSFPMICASLSYFSLLYYMVSSKICVHRTARTPVPSILGHSKFLEQSSLLESSFSYKTITWLISYLRFQPQ